MKGNGKIVALGAAGTVLGLIAFGFLINSLAEQNDFFAQVRNGFDS